MLTIYLLRHGQTQWNAEGGKYLGRTDLPLTEKGIAQAKEAAGQLKDIDFTAVYSSPLQRAAVTAQIAGGGKEVITDARLLETDFGNWEGKTKDETLKEDPAIMASWDEDPGKTKAGGTGETAQNVLTRTLDFFTQLQQRHSDGNILVVAHNGVNRFYLSHKLGMPLKNYHQIIQDNATVTVFTLDRDGMMTLHKLNSRL
ncbi:MAG: histidine phosphatase family protein [Bacteroidetes bacterium]|nr:histidine phosphatase family protein [Bacteroidota bacterium]